MPLRSVPACLISFWQVSYFLSARCLFSECFLRRNGLKILLLENQLFKTCKKIKEVIFILFIKFFALKMRLEIRFFSIFAK